MTDRKSIISALRKITEYSLYVLIFSIPFSKTMIEVCAIIAIVTWLLRKILLGKEGLRLMYTELNLPLGIFYLVCFISIFYSTHQALSARAFVSKISEYLLLYFIVVETVDNKKTAKNMIISMAASLSILCIDCIYQLITGFDFIRHYPMFGLKMVEIRGVFQEFKGFDSIFSRTVQGYPVEHLIRITGSLKFPNGLSTFLLMSALPFVSLALFFRKNVKLKTVCIILATFSIYCLILTYTRGAIISFILALTLMLFLRTEKKHLSFLFILLIIGVILVFALPKEMMANIGLRDIFSYGTSTQHRLRMWTAAWNMFMEKPFTGQGLNAFMMNFERFKVAGESVEGVWYAHNCYLQMAAEIGVFGLLAFLWMAFRMFLVSCKSWRLIEDEFLRYAYLGLFCGITGFLIHIAVEMSLYSLQLAAFFYVSLGLLMGIRRTACHSGRREATSRNL